MIPLFDNDVFELNGKYDHEPSWTGIMQVGMMINPVDAKGKQFSYVAIRMQSVSCWISVRKHND